MGNIKFKWNPSGYREIKNSAGVQSILESKARAVKTQASSMLSDGGYSAIDDFEIHDVTNSKDSTKAKIVVTHSLHAMRSQNKNKTLEKALSAARRG